MSNSKASLVKCTVNAKNVAHPNHLLKAENFEARPVLIPGSTSSSLGGVTVTTFKVQIKKIAIVLRITISVLSRRLRILSHAVSF